MKKFLALCLLAVGLPVLAQQNVYIWQGGDFDKVVLAPTEDMPFTNAGNTITIGGKAYDVNLIDSLTFATPVLDKTGKVVVSYAGGQATVSIPAGVSGVTASVSGAHVQLTSTNITDELEYVLEGASANGSLTYTGSYKCKFYLNGLQLTSAQGAAIDIQCGKRIDLVLFEGTSNTLTDCVGGLQKATLYCKGHLEVKGGGTLTVTGRTKHAISSKEYLIVKKSVGKIAVAGAVSDGIHCGQYFQMNGGEVDITNVQGDGIQAEELLDPTKELDGQMIIQGGVIRIDVPGADVKGLKCDMDLTISGGKIDIDVTGNGSKGISTNASMTVGEEDGPTDITVLARGGKLPDPAGGTTKCMGIKVDYNLTVTGGRITVKPTGDDARGIKVDGTYYYRGGTVTPEPDAVAKG
ncbi:MAG: carbohydrate-binding domain-containing protein [Clostridium sp.]|nr:carbohydrate-binding domain-containing protein [Clostridium sp.]